MGPDAFCPGLKRKRQQQQRRDRQTGSGLSRLIDEDSGGESVLGDTYSPGQPGPVVNCPAAGAAPLSTPKNKVTAA